MPVFTRLFVPGGKHRREDKIHFQSCDDNGSASLQMRLGDLSDEIAVFQQNGLFIERFRQFEQLPQETEKNSEKKRNKIPFRKLEMKQVCFGYSPEKRVLQNIDLCIHKGEKVAVVGRNGSGKTTLIKLLLRLYEPDAGKMKYNGRSAQEIAVDDYRNCFSAMFQDFSIYEASVAENVAMSRQIKNGCGMRWKKWSFCRSFRISIRKSGRSLEKKANFCPAVSCKDLFWQGPSMRIGKFL